MVAPAQPWLEEMVLIRDELGTCECNYSSSCIAYCIRISEMACNKDVQLFPLTDEMATEPHIWLDMFLPPISSRFAQSTLVSGSAVTHLPLDVSRELNLIDIG